MRQRNTAEIPYPPVFHDWRPDLDIRIATSVGPSGVRVEMRFPNDPSGAWRGIELTEQDACVLAAAILQKVAYVNGEPPTRAVEKLVEGVLKAAGNL